MHTPMILSTAEAWPHTCMSSHAGINFFYVNIGLGTLGISPLPVVAENPVSEVSVIPPDTLPCLCPDPCSPHTCGG